MKIIRPVEYPAMDGLRFYAAFIVFMTHFIGSIRTSVLNTPSSAGADETLFNSALIFLGDGHHGVDLFFVLSGFLMGRIAFSDKRPFMYFRFIQSRFWRIYPTFLLSYIAVVLLDLHFGWPWSLPDAIAGLLFLNAIPALKIIPYHYVSWSLGFEFLFYLIFPVILLLPKGVPKEFKAGIALLLFLILTVSNPNFTWMMRTSGLFLGLWISSFKIDRLKSIGQGLPWPIALLPYVVYLLVKQEVPHTQSYGLLLFSTSAIFVSVVFGDNPLSRLASLPTFRFLGTISYSFYLWHTMCISVSLFVVLPFFGLTAYGPETTAGLHLLASFFFSVVISYVSYVFTEQHYFVRPEQHPSH